jgi:predicted kinase
VVCGPPASGKSVLARGLAEACQWPHVATDVERKRLAGLQPTERASAEHYTAAFSQRTYERVFATAAEALSGESLSAEHRAVLLDGNFATRAQRREAAAAARRCGAELTFVHVQVDVATAVERAGQRAEAGTDSSDAGAEVTRQRHASFEPPGDDEGAVVRVDGSRRPERLADDALAALLDAAYADSGADERSARS